MAAGGRGRDYEVDDDEKPTGADLGTRRKFTEFECASCSAHNPLGDPFGNGDEIFCGYCGQSFVAQVDEDGVLRLRET